MINRVKNFIVEINNMKHNKKYIIYIIIAMVISIGYIVAFEYYDSHSNTIQSLYEKIPNRNLKEVYVNLIATKEGEILSVEELTQRENELIGAMSHDETCSKLCGVNCHYDNTDSIVELNKDEAVFEINNVDDSVPYKLKMVSNKDGLGSTSYNFKYMGTDDLELLDARRARAKEFLNNNNVEIKECIYFTGEIEGYLDYEERGHIASDIMGNLGSDIKGRYIGESSEGEIADESAYYGYTNMFKDYIIGMDGQKNNMEVNFSYNEKLDTTTYRVAFPFFNNPY